MPFNANKLAQFQAKAAASRTGGKGTARRKHKVVHKKTTVDDKKLKTTLNRLNVRDIPAIEEVNLFKEDSSVIHFENPKVQAAIPANTYVVSGTAQNKKLQDLLPGIIAQLGPDNLEHLKNIYSNIGGDKIVEETQDSDDDVPELVDNFEETANADADKDEIA